MDSTRNISDIHRDSKFIQSPTEYIKGGIKYQVYPPCFKFNLAGGSIAVYRFWRFFSFVFDIGTEYAASAFMSGEFWPSKEDQAVDILYRMGKDIALFQSFYAEYATGPLFQVMISPRRGSNKEKIWDFTKDGIQFSSTASYIVKEISTFVSLFNFLASNPFSFLNSSIAESRMHSTIATPQPPKVLYLPLSIPKGSANSWSLTGAKAAYATAVLDYITSLLSEDANNVKTCESRYLAYYQSDILISVVKALLDNFELLPVAHALQRTFSSTSLPCTLLAFAAAVVS